MHDPRRRVVGGPFSRQPARASAPAPGTLTVRQTRVICATGGHRRKVVFFLLFFPFFPHYAIYGTNPFLETFLGRSSRRGHGGGMQSDAACVLSLDTPGAGCGQRRAAGGAMRAHTHTRRSRWSEAHVPTCHSGRLSTGMRNDDRPHTHKSIVALSRQSGSGNL